MARFKMVVEEDSSDNTPADDGGKIGDPQDKQTDKVVIPDLKDLNVNEVAKAEHEITKEMSSQSKPMEDDIVPQEQRTVALKSATDDAAQLVNAVESLVSSLDEWREVSKQQAQQADAYLNKVKDFHGLKNTYRHSLERFDSISEKSRETGYLLEGFVDTIKSIWQACMRLIDKAIAWFKGFISKYFFSVKNDIEVSKDVMGELEALHKVIKDQKVVDNDHWINSPELFMHLSLGGKIPNLAEGFEYIYALAKTFRHVELQFAPNWIKMIEDSLPVLLDPEKHINQIPATIWPDPEAFTINDKTLPIRALNGTIYWENEYAGSRAAENMLWMRTVILPGNFSIGYMVDEQTQNKQSRATWTISSGLEALSQWKIKCARTTYDTVQDGWFPLMSLNEIRDITEMQVKALRELETFKNNPDGVERIMKRLQEVCDKAKTQAAGVDAGKLDAHGVEKLRYTNLIVSAITAIINNVNYAMAEIGKYVRAECLAWTHFLRLVKQEYLKVAQLPSK